MFTGPCFMAKRECPNPSSRPLHPPPPPPPPPYLIPSTDPSHTQNRKGGDVDDGIEDLKGYNEDDGHGGGGGECDDGDDDGDECGGSEEAMMTTRPIQVGKRDRDGEK